MTRARVEGIRVSRFLPLRVVESFIPLMQKRGVSEVARSPRGFLTAFRRAGGPGGLSPDWLQRREAFIARHEAQVRRRGEPLYERDGSPTRRHLALIAWAYSPDEGALRSKNPGDGDDRLRRLERAGRHDPRARYELAREQRRRGIPSRLWAGAVGLYRRARDMHRWDGMTVREGALRTMQEIPVTAQQYAGSPERGHDRGFAALHDLVDANMLVPFSEAPLDHLSFPPSDDPTYESLVDEANAAYTRWFNDVTDLVGQRIRTAYDPTQSEVSLFEAREVFQHPPSQRTEEAGVAFRRAVRAFENGAVTLGGAFDQHATEWLGLLEGRDPEPLIQGEIEAQRAAGYRGPTTMADGRRVHLSPRVQALTAMVFG